MKKKIKKFDCHCKMHQIDVDAQPMDDGTEYIGITIYEHRSGITGKLFKKPREEATVVLIGDMAKRFKKHIAE